MATATHDDTATSLVAGILNDIQELLGQHLSLLKHEIRADLQKSRDIALALAGGAVVALLAAVVLLAFVVGGLNYAMPSIPWWGWSGIVGATLALAAGAMIASGVRKAQTLNPLPDETAQAAKENMQWITKPK